MADRLERARKYSAAWAPYVWPIAGIEDIRIAPFHVLASEGAVHFDKPHAWHIALAHRLADVGGPATQATAFRALALNDERACADAIAWWEELTLRGGEGMVVKPADFIVRGEKGLLQPALKVRGSEYLRIIYGPEYDAPEHLSRLRQRGLGGKLALACPLRQSRAPTACARMRLRRAWPRKRTDRSEALTTGPIVRLRFRLYLGRARSPELGPMADVRGSCGRSNQALADGIMLTGT